MLLRSDRSRSLRHKACYRPPVVARSFSELVHALEVLLVLELGAPGAVALGFVLVRARRRTLDHLRGNGQLLLPAKQQLTSHKSSIKRVAWKQLPVICVSK